MPRSSMADLIARTRTLIGDPAGGTQVFTDDQVQDALDDRRTDVVEALLRTRPSFAGSAVVYHDYFAPRRQWEDSVVLYGATGTVLTPTSADLIAGHWTFASGQAQPVYITGSFYDVNGSAATLLQSWAAKVSPEFDFATDQQSFNRSQKREGLLAVALELTRTSMPPGRRPAWRSADW